LRAFGEGIKITHYSQPYAPGARLATGGGSKIRLTRRSPQRGHIIRSRRPERDMLRPRVQAKVSKLSSAWCRHLVFERVYSAVPSRQRP
jgi:hypothetical protein